MGWTELSSIKQLLESFNNSEFRPQLYFKHSNRCGISKMALKEFENSGVLNYSQADFFLLDLLNYREISNEIVALSGIEHQSPQVVFIHNNKVIYSESHGTIDGEKIINILEDLI
jgi:bacillithiol system protein YtxJ